MMGYQVNYYRFVSLLLFNPLSATAAQVLECPVGWGDNTKIIQIPPDRMNDGYCDCPTTGLDEIETDACSGSVHWPGIHPGDTLTPKFQCPGQPQLQLPLSHVRDGICDCCSGADEAHGVCENICDQVLAAEREQAEQRLLTFQEGSLKRKKELESFSELREKTARELEGERSKILSLESRLNETKDQLAQLKLKRVEQRLKIVKEQTTSIAADPDSGILNGLSSTELSWMIVHACQAAGEVQAMFFSEEKEAKPNGSSNRNNDLTTCIPLRLAGLDAGLIWESMSYKPKFIEDAADMTLLAELLAYNVEHIGTPVWTQQTLDKARSRRDKHQNRRRLTEVNPDDEDYSDEDILDDFEDENQRRRRKQPKGSDEPVGKSEQEERRIKVEQLILEQPFSRHRVSFRQQAERLKAVIDAANVESEGGDTNATEKADQSDSSDQSQPVVDPISFPFIKNKLDGRIRIVQTGLDFAVSAKVLVDELNVANPPDLHGVLQSLLIGTLIHGNLSSLHFWDFIVNIVPGFQPDDDDPKTCKAPITCPPAPIQRGSITIPAMGILKSVEESCTFFLEQAQQFCVLDEGEDAFPHDIPNGYGDLFVLNGRDETDIFHTIFADLILTDNADMRREVDELKEKISLLEKELDDLQDSISEMVNLVDGGKDGGELYFLKNSCHSIESGKYTYELCLHGSATQSEVSHGGTNLGKWEGASVEDTGDRVWKWTNGAKCWNGPKRSATVHLTCGIENKLISADEPDTCRYVFEMESYIACDESYRQRYGLPSSD